MIESISLDGVSHSFAQFLSQISGQPLTDSTPIQPLALFGFAPDEGVHLITKKGVFVGY